MERFYWNFAAIILVTCATSIGCEGASQTAAPKAAATNAEHSHEGWWCADHGVPEDVCALCDVTLVADFKSKGDWCDEHDRPESQCFVCNPEQEKAFAAAYSAKYGTSPPVREANAEEHRHDHDQEHEHEHGDGHDHDPA